MCYNELSNDSIGGEAVARPRPRDQEQDVLLTEVLNIDDVIAVYHPENDDDNIYAMLDDLEAWNTEMNVVAALSA